jgi:hypothetical protein
MGLLFRNCSYTYLHKGNQWYQTQTSYTYVFFTGANGSYKKLGGFPKALAGYEL